MRRREFITLIGGAAAAWRCNALAQSPPRRSLVGVLLSGSKAAGARYYNGFPLGMRELGYLEGRDYAVEVRYADGDASRLPSLAEELVGLKPDVIVVTSTPGALAAKQATASIPIVGVNMTDPVGFGLVTTFHTSKNCAFPAALDLRDCKVLQPEIARVATRISYNQT